MDNQSYVGADRTDQKFLSFALASLWKLMLGLAGLTCKSKAVVLTFFCSSPVSRARLSVKVSAMRKSTSVLYRNESGDLIGNRSIEVDLGLLGSD